MTNVKPFNRGNQRSNLYKKQESRNSYEPNQQLCFYFLPLFVSSWSIIIVYRLIAYSHTSCITFSNVTIWIYVSNHFLIDKFQKTIANKLYYVMIFFN